MPNFSEGQNFEVIRLLAEGERVLGKHSDPLHHRTVITMVDGNAERLIADLLDKVAIAIENIDLRQQRGLHPRVGSADVLPIVPLGDTSMEVAIITARQLGERIWQQLKTPVYYYGKLAGGRRLADIRRRVVTPDLGDAPHLTAGVCCVTARPPLVAYNITFELPWEQIRQLARAMRQLPGVQALDFALDEQHTQLSMNLVKPFQFGAEQAYRQATLLAGVKGVPELVGLCPAAAAGPGCAEGLLEDRMLQLAAHLREREPKLRTELLRTARQGYLYPAINLESD
ncbi:MAG: hypothetical protein ACREN8_01725 [Candidatus Dormibacteraceae bacterium]